MPVEMTHGGCVPAYGYLLEKGNVTLGYTGDAGICDNFFKMCEKADYMLVDTTTLQPVPMNKVMHISFEELKEIAEQYNACQFYAVHRGDYEVNDKGKVQMPMDGDEIAIN